MDKNRDRDNDNNENVDSPTAWSHLTGLLDGYDVPPVPDKAQLIARLKPLVEARQTVHQQTPLRSNWHLRAWLALMGAQVTLLEPPFWIAMFIIAALGVTIGLFADAGTLPMLFTWAAPVLGAVGVAYAYRPATEGLRELERISPVHPIELLYARLIPVLVCNAILALILLSLIGVRTPDLVLWRIVLVWFGPLLGLTGLALYCAVRWGSTVGVAAPVLSWGALNLFGWTQFSTQNMVVQSMAAFDPIEMTHWLWLQASASNWALIGSAVAFSIGSVCFWQAQRVLGAPADGKALAH